MPPEMPSDPEVAFERLHVEETVKSSFRSNQRLLLLGAIGAGKASLVRRTLNAAGIRVVEWDFRFAGTMRAVNAIAGATAVPGGSGPSGSLVGALSELEKHSKEQPTALLIRNVDALAGSRGDNGLVGWLRSEVQMVSTLRIIFTAHDTAFIHENFDKPDGAFFKQVGVCEVPPLTPDEVGRSVSGLCSVVNNNAISALFDYSGGNSAILDSILRSGLDRRCKAEGSLTKEAVDDAARLILRASAPVYATTIQRFSARQRAVLKALAVGLPMKADTAMINLTGIERSSLGVVFKSLIREGLIRQEGYECIFSDPLLRLYLRYSD